MRGLIYKPGKNGFDVNWTKLTKLDYAAKTEGSLVGRFFTEPFADGQAVYQVVKENKKTVRIKVCTGLGDDWVIPYWGEESTVDKDYIEKKIANNDAMLELIKKSKKEF